MTLLLLLRPRFGGEGGPTPPHGGGLPTVGGGHRRQIHIYEDSYYDKAQPKKAKVNPADIHPFFRDKPEIAKQAIELLDQGFGFDEILLFFMMIED